MAWSWVKLNLLLSGGSVIGKNVFGTHSGGRFGSHELSSQGGSHVERYAKLLSCYNVGFMGLGFMLS